MEGGLQDCYAVVFEHVQELGWYVRCVDSMLEVGVDRTVVLPALSRPRKRSLACLFASPSWASKSQTVYHVSLPFLLCQDIAVLRTPIDDPHGRVLEIFDCLRKYRSVGLL